MGSDAHLVVVGAGVDELAERAQARIDQLEARWSRFRADSEISLLNRRAGTPVVVSPDTVGLIERATEAWRFSGGAFDPTVLGPMIRAGYDRSFDQLGSDVRPVPSLLGTGAADIVIDGDEVTLPAGTGFDAGGIGKGLAADVVVAEIMAGGAQGACVNLGGDVRVAGCGPDGGPWTVGVWHPELAEPVTRVGLADGAVATSTTRLRRWTVGGAPHHHLIDPRSGLPSDSDLELATVVAAEAWVAEVLAKSVILRGSAHPFDVVEATAAQALAVDRLGRVQATEGLAAFLGSATLPGALDLSGFAAPAVPTPR
jgi:FAD:protein FMN transferase